MVTGLIFDLDDTLVNSTIASDARTRRVWQEVYSLIPSFTLFEGIEELCSLIRQERFKTCIVSTAPKRYVERVVNYFNLPFRNIIGYHDARIKPAPDAMYAALQLMGSNPLETISFGDRSIDILAANRAGIPSAACLWGCHDIGDLRSVPSTFCFNTPYEVSTYLKQRHY